MVRDRDDQGTTSVGAEVNLSEDMLARMTLRGACTLVNTKGSTKVEMSSIRFGDYLDYKVMQLLYTSQGVTLNQYHILTIDALLKQWQDQGFTYTIHPQSMHHLIHPLWPNSTGSKYLTKEILAIKPGSVHLGLSDIGDRSFTYFMNLSDVVCSAEISW